MQHSHGQAVPTANVTVLVGAQWGDEGKGKWIDVLARDADLVVRYQGGNNAGHTLYIDGEKVVLHQVPSGVFHAQQKSALAAGVVVNPTQLVAELAKIAAVKKQTPLTPDRLWLSGRAHVITPWHIHLDTARETNSKTPIGTTKRGIGPTYADKAARSGMRLGHYVDDAARGRWIARMLETSAEFKAHYEAQESTWKEFASAAARLKPFVCDAEAKIRSYAQAGKRLLVEGAQGTLLDLDHGTYPYVTSSGTGAGGACQSIGLSPKLIGKLVGIAKAYVTRVGEGPFPTELKDAVGKGIAERGQEFGATTGRPRRVGWMDAVALRYVVNVNGLDGIALNKIDILSGVDQVKIAVAYKHPELGVLKELPWDTEVVAQCEPIYETYPGWTETITGGGDYSALPKNCRQFIEAIEKHGETKVMMVGTGPKREDCVFRA